MDLKKWGIVDNRNVEEDEKIAEELKRLRIVADMCAALIPDMDEFLLERHTDSIARIITPQKFSDYERKNNNIRLALKFAGYTSVDEKGAPAKPLNPEPQTKIVRLKY